MVLVGRFGTPHQAMTAAAAVSFFLRAPDARGLEVLVPRAIRLQEIVRIRSLPQIAGWRFYPEAKGHPPAWPAPGDIKAARVRRKIDESAEPAR
jgi:hypothetical protein